MRRIAAVVAVLVSATLAAGEDQTDDDLRVHVGGVAELRFAHTGDSTSWLDGGLGKARYGSKGGGAADLLAVPQLALVVDANYQEILTAHLQINADAEPDAALQRGRVGLIEGYLGYHYDLSPLFRLRVRGGIFFPPISIENSGTAWTTIYTITPSAVSSWVGEEVRTTGVEARLGVVSDRNELWLTGAAFGWNDPAGSLLAWRGWALHDRQTMTGEKLPLPPISSIGEGGLFAKQAPWASPVREVDGRVGFYGGARLRALGRLQLDGLYYDNRGDPTSFDGQQYGWATRFWNASAKLRLPAGFELLGQYMGGKTGMGRLPDGRLMASIRFQAWHLLGSFAREPVRVSLRYDDFSAVDRDPFPVEDDNNEDGHAWTAAVTVKPVRHLLLMAEWLRVESSRPFRADLGITAGAREDLLQLGVRFDF